MRIAIVGTGNIGGTLGSAWGTRGHSIHYATRTPDSDVVRALVARSGPRAHATSLAQAVGDADLVVLAVPWDALEEVLRADAAFAGKVLVDCTNPLGPGFRLRVPNEGSGAQRVAALVPAARVVKAFNAAGFNVFADPRLAGQAADLYLCGDDEAAKQQVATLAAELGLVPIDCGALTQAHLLEALATLWISLAYGRGRGREIAFKLLQR
jgi:hypothetical protein